MDSVLFVGLCRCFQESRGLGRTPGKELLIGRNRKQGADRGPQPADAEKNGVRRRPRSHGWDTPDGGNLTSSWELPILEIVPSTRRKEEGRERRKVAGGLGSLMGTRIQVVGAGEKEERRVKGTKRGKPH